MTPEQAIQLRDLWKQILAEEVPPEWLKLLAKLK